MVSKGGMSGTGLGWDAVLPTRTIKRGSSVLFQCGRGREEERDTYDP